MNDKFSITVSDVSFFGYHGVYAEEQLLGNNFRLNLTVSFYASHTISSIRDTVNYVDLYVILENEMKKPRILLETLLTEIAEHIHQQFPEILHIELEIEKMWLPVPKFTGSAKVKIIRAYE